MSDTSPPQTFVAQQDFLLVKLWMSLPPPPISQKRCYVSAIYYFNENLGLLFIG